MQSSCQSPRTLLPLLLPLIAAAAALVQTAAAACPVLGPGADPQTKAYIAPVVFHGTLTALERKGPVFRATFRVDRALKGLQQKQPDLVVEFALRQNPARCRGSTLAAGDLELRQRYIVFAAWRRKKMIAVARPEDYTKKKAISRVLCDKCGKSKYIMQSILHILI